CLIFALLSHGEGFVRFRCSHPLRAEPCTSKSVGTSLFSLLPEVRDDFPISSERSPGSRNDPVGCRTSILDTNDSPPSHSNARWAAYVAGSCWKAISSDYRRWRISCRWHHVSPCSSQTPAAQVP